MRVLFAKDTSELFKSNQILEPLLLNNSREHDNNINNNDDSTKFVQLEIPINALKRLVNEQLLTIEELHCLNRRSKKMIHQAILKSLTIK